MSRTSMQTIGDVHIVISNENLTSGWDIVALTAGGRNAMPERAGEFATEDEAIAAAKERAEQFKAATLR